MARTQREAVAFHYDYDVSDLEEYQPGVHGKARIFLVASGDAYAVALKVGKKPTAGMLKMSDGWKERADELLERSYGWKIFEFSPTVDTNH